MVEDKDLSTRKIIVGKTKKVKKKKSTLNLFDHNSQLDPEKDSSQTNLEKIKFSEDDVIDRRYRIIKELGRGSFSVVYRVYDVKMDVEKALKIFGRRSHDYSLTERFEAEAKTLAALNHPDIVRIYEYPETSAYLYLDMELVEGLTLKEYLNGKKLNNRDIKRISIDIINALNYAYQKNIKHHDINLNNILINSDGNIKITDFGIAEKFKGQQDDYVLGTDNYLAPEKIKEGVSDFYTDIFAFGVVLNQLKYRDYPYTNVNFGEKFELNKKLLNSKKRIDKIIKKCLSVFPEDRYRSYNQLKEDLEKIETGLKKKSRLREYYNRFIVLRDKPESLRKDIHGLLLILILLLILLPFYLRYGETRDFYDYITISSGDYNVRVNFHEPISDSGFYRLRKGDLIQFLDDDGISHFDYFYRGEKYLNFRLEDGRIYLNNNKKGVIITSLDQLPLKDNLAYVRSEINIKAADLPNIKNRYFVLSLGMDVEAETLKSMSEEVYFLNLSQNHSIDSFESLPSENLRKLRGIDFSKPENIEDYQLKFDEAENFSNIHWLNLNNTNVESLSPLSSLSNLKHLSVEQNNLNDIRGLYSMRNLQSLHIGNNENLDEVLPYLNSRFLRNISMEGISLSDEEERRKINRYIEDNVDSDKTFLSTDEYELIAYFLNIVALVLVSFLLYKFIKLLLKDYKTGLTEDSSNKKDHQKKLNNYSEKNYDSIDKAIENNKLYLPEDDCALSLLKEKLTEDPQNKTLKERKKLIFKTIVKKFYDYFKAREYEPAYIAASKSRQIIESEPFLKLERKSKKKLLKNKPMSMRFVKGGNFYMGDFTKESTSNAYLHKVYLKNYYISDIVVTNQLFCEFLNNEGLRSEGGVDWINISSSYCRIYMKNGKYYVEEPYNFFPVYEVSWFGAMRYCLWAGGRLPTEAEWEYAARNRGKNNVYSTGDEIDIKKSNYLVDENDDRWHSVKPVRSFEPNKLGLFEMSGNILEWCYDYYHKDYYRYSPKTNPMGPSEGNNRVVRGGGWCFGKEHMKTFYRGSAKPTSRNNFIGFRLMKESR